MAKEVAMQTLLWDMEHMSLSISKISLTAII